MSGKAASHRRAGIVDTCEGVITSRGPQAGQYWRFLDSSIPAFDSGVFDEAYLAEHDLIDGSALAGRGNTFFLTLDDHRLVLRHYRRGGLIRHVSTRGYAYTGLARTRAMREFSMLVHLQGLGLPAPAPYACEVVHRAFSYEASLVTHCIPGRTLAERFYKSVLSDNLWSAIGATIAGFHQCGVFHADLNAHNILIDEQDRVFLIDFDRARIRRIPTGTSERGWCHANIERLDRSLQKIASQRGDESSAGVSQWESTRRAGFAQLREGWLTAMQRCERDKH